MFLPVHSVACGLLLNHKWLRCCYKTYLLSTAEVCLSAHYSLLLITATLRWHVGLLRKKMLELKISS